MKKNLLLTLLPILVLSAVSSCKPVEKEYTGSNELFISEFYTGKYFIDSAIEITNNSTESIDLKDYSFKIYSRNDLKNEIPLSGTINANESFVYKNKDFDDSKNNDLSIGTRLDDNYFDGIKYIELVNNATNLIYDSLGTKGYDLTYASDTSLVKLKEYFTGHVVNNKLYYVKTKSTVTKFLGNTDVPIALNELLEGPKLTSIYKEGALTDEKGSNPTGNYAEVTLKDLGDGDTTYFNFPDYSLLADEHRSVRYLFIDTPEVAHGDKNKAQKWAVSAQNHNNKLLKEAKHILVQTNRGAALREVYGRLLGYVWISDLDNPSPSDYKLLNFDMLVNGYCHFNNHDLYEEMMCGDLLYFDYFEYALNYAEGNKIRLYGSGEETD